MILAPSNVTRLAFHAQRRCGNRFSRTGVGEQFRLRAGTRGIAVGSRVAQAPKRSAAGGAKNPTAKAPKNLTPKAKDWTLGAELGRHKDALEKFEAGNASSVSRAESKSGLARRLNELAQIRSVKDLGLWAQPELRFTQFPQQPGHRVTLGGLLAVNVAVYAGWQLAYYENTLVIDGVDRHRPNSWEAFMTKWFLWENDWKEKGHYWTILTKSVSHKTFPHLAGNMVVLLYLGRHLHALVGRKHLLVLYVAGGLCSSLGSELWPSYSAAEVALSDRRYLNALEGQPHGAMWSMGASGSLMAFVACFYLTFPRYRVHLFQKVRKTPSWPRSWAIQLQVFIAVFPQECMGQLASFWANLTPFSLKAVVLKRVLRFDTWQPTGTATRLVNNFSNAGVSALWMLPIFFANDLCETFLVRAASSALVGK
jgi:membrane associated rhomboid family serine protease